MSERTARQHLKLAQDQLVNAASNIREAKHQIAARNSDIRWTADDQIVAGLSVQVIHGLINFVQFGRPYADQFASVVEDLVRERQALDKKFPGSGQWPAITQTEHGP